VFDAIWQRLESQRSPLTFPWAIEATRFTLAQLVLEYLDDSKDLHEVMRRLEAEKLPIPGKGLGAKL
jgi:hypothetical protein